MGAVASALGAAGRASTRAQMSQVLVAVVGVSATWGLRITVVLVVVYVLDGVLGAASVLGLRRRRSSIAAARAKLVAAVSADQPGGSARDLVATTRLVAAFLDIAALLALEASCRGAFEEVAADEAWKRLYLRDFGAPRGERERVDAASRPASSDRSVFSREFRLKM